MRPFFSIAKTVLRAGIVLAFPALMVACQSAPSAKPVSEAPMEPSAGPRVLKRQIVKPRLVALPAEYVAPAGETGLIRPGIANIAPQKGQAPDESGNPIPFFGPVLKIGTQGMDFRAEFRAYEWTHFFTERQMTVAALEYTVEGPAWDLPIVATSDGGKSWLKVLIHKPHYTALLEAIKVNPQGIWFRLVWDPELNKIAPSTFIERDMAYGDYLLAWSGDAIEYLKEPVEFSPSQRALPQERREAAIQAVIKKPD